MSCGLNFSGHLAALEKSQAHGSRLDENQAKDYSCRTCTEYDFVRATYAEFQALQGDDRRTKMRERVAEYLTHWQHVTPLNNKAALGLGLCFAFVAEHSAEYQAFIGAIVDDLYKVLDLGCGVDPEMFKEHNNQTDAVLLYTAFWNKCQAKQDKHPVHPVLVDILTMKAQVAKLPPADLLATCEQLVQVLECKKSTREQILTAMITLAACFYPFHENATASFLNVIPSEAAKANQDKYREYMADAVLAVLNQVGVISTLTFQVALISLVMHLEWKDTLCPELLDTLLRFKYLPKWMHFYILKQQRVEPQECHLAGYDKCTFQFIQAQREVAVPKKE